jgi:hypothetical protein
MEYIIDITIRLIYLNNDFVRELWDSNQDVINAFYYDINDFLISFKQFLISLPLPDQFSIISNLFYLICTILIEVVSWSQIEAIAFFNFWFFYYFCEIVPNSGHPIESYLFTADSQFASDMANLGISLAELNQLVKFFYFTSSPVAWFKLYPARIIFVGFLIILLQWLLRYVTFDDD